MSDFLPVYLAKLKESAVTTAPADGIKTIVC